MYRSIVQTMGKNLILPVYNDMVSWYGEGETILQFEMKTARDKVTKSR